MIAAVLLAGFFGFSLFLQYDEGIVWPVLIVDDIMTPYKEYIRHSNYDATNVLDCNDEKNPYFEYECFRDAFSNCYNAIVHPEIYTIEGDPIYTTLEITPDCDIRGTADTSTDRFATPEIIITKCNSVGRGDFTWSVGGCDIQNLSEMQFNFEMQLFPKILECEENGNIWDREKLECVVKIENENHPFGLTGPVMRQETCNDFVISQWQPRVEDREMIQQFLEICVQRGFLTHELVERGKVADNFTMGPIQSAHTLAEGDIEKTIEILEKMYGENEN